MSESAANYGPIGRSDEQATYLDAAYAAAVLVVSALAVSGPLPFEAAVIVLLGIIAIQQVA